MFLEHVHQSVPPDELKHTNTHTHTVTWLAVSQGWMEMRSIVRETKWLFSFLSVCILHIIWYNARNQWPKVSSSGTLSKIGCGSLISYCSTLIKSIWWNRLLGLRSAPLPPYPIATTRFTFEATILNHSNL